MLVIMIVLKDSPRAHVRHRSNGTVSKRLRGPNAKERFENEVRVLRFLESKSCPCVPRLIRADVEQLEIVITNCGAVVQHLSPRKFDEIFASLEAFGVRHEDPAIRNVTYRASDGCFCVIDFELATIINESYGPASLNVRIEKQFDELENLVRSAD